VEIEELGTMALGNDVEASDFGAGIARDLANGLDKPSGAIAIIKRGRTVRSIPVE
jgi:hypothetical protein